jgi:transcriptional regulator
MHPNPVFHTADAARNLAFARQRRFGVLTISAEAGPLAAHIPFILSEDGSEATAHLVRSNPIWRALREPCPALLVVSGPDAYISPDWYRVAHQVPTWNYVAVHLRGQLRRLPQEDLRQHLDDLSALNEGALPKPPWTNDKMPTDLLDRMMRTIAPVALRIEAVDGTWKLNQNKAPEARLHAADMLHTSPMGQETVQLADMMRTGE